MKFWSAPTSIFPYSLDEVVSAFWDRYPNDFAKHILSEDVIDRVITENTIVTRKLIVKEGNSILKRVPRWLSRMTHIRQVPVLEESVYDRNMKTLTTYTRNVSHNELFALHERCHYKAHPDSLQFPMTDVQRSVNITFNCGRLSSVYANIMLLGFKKSVTKTTKGMSSVLEKMFGHRNVNKLPSEKLKKIKEKLLKSSLVSEVKCESEEKQ